MRPVPLTLALLLAGAPAPAQTPQGLEVRTDALGHRARAFRDSPGRAPVVATPSTVVHTPFEPTGPWGGDVADLAASPTAYGLVLAGITPPELIGGGLYRSTDTGATWTKVPTLAGMSVHDLEFDANGVAYAGTLDSIWTSADDGQSFSQLDLGIGIDDEVLEVTLGPGAIWAGVAEAQGTQTANLLVSTDGGGSWTDRTPPGAAGTGCRGIALDPSNPSRLLACFGGAFGGGSVWFSDDAGATWVDRSAGLPDAPMTDLAYQGARVLLSGGQLFGGQDLGLYSTEDEGATWSPLHDASWPTLVARDIEVSGGLTAVLNIATHGGGIIRSADGGATWMPNIGGTDGLHVEAVTAVPGQPLSALAGCAVLGVLKNSDGGLSLTASSTGIRELRTASIQTFGAPGGELALTCNGLNTGAIYTSPDGGETWSREMAPMVRWNEADFDPFGVLYALSDGPVTIGPEAVWKRKPAGAWLHLGPDVGPLVEMTLACIKISKLDQSILVGGRDQGPAGDESAIWLSTDLGTSWTRTYEGPALETVRDVRFLSHAPAGQPVLAAFTDEGPTATGGLLRSDDGGATWNAPVSGLPAGLQGRSVIHAPFIDSTYLLADAQEGPGNGGVHVTTDGGQSWTKAAGTTGPVHRIERDPLRPGELYAVRRDATPLVEKTTDVGATFTSYVDGLEPSLVVSDAVFFEGVNSSLEQCDDLLLATDHGLWTRLIHCALEADVDEISLSTGGTQTLTLSLGPKHAFEWFMLLGSASGTSPGFEVDGFLVPLNPDWYFSYSIQSANLPPFSNTVGQFDGLAITNAQLSLPPGSPPQLAGLTLYHAYASIETTPLPAVGLVSNVSSLTLLP